MRNLAILMTSAGALLAAVSCAIDPPGRPQARIAFEKNVLLVPAGQVAIETSYQAPLNPPNIDHLRKDRPAQIPKKWLEKRAKTIAGAPGILKLTITDAAATEKVLPIKTDWKHAFDRQSDAQYNAHLAWRLDYEGPSLTWMTSGEASSMRTVLEQASPNESDMDYNLMLEALAHAFDERITKQIGELRDALAKTGAPAAKS